MAFDVALRDNGTGSFDISLSSTPATLPAQLNNYKFVSVGDGMSTTEKLVH